MAAWVAAATLGSTLGVGEAALDDADGVDDPVVLLLVQPASNASTSVASRLATAARCLRVPFTTM
jgi:hypothetical protein